MLDPVIKAVIEKSFEWERVILNSMAVPQGLALVSTSGLISDSEMKRQASEMFEKAINKHLINIKNENSK
jgi:hypothetical protein